MNTGTVIYLEPIRSEKIVLPDNVYGIEFEVNDKDSCVGQVASAFQTGAEVEFSFKRRERSVTGEIHTLTYNFRGKILMMTLDRSLGTFIFHVGYRYPDDMVKNSGGW